MKDDTDLLIEEMSSVELLNEFVEVYASKKDM